MRFMTVSVRDRPRGDGKMQCEGAATVRLAVDTDEAAVAPHRVVDNRQTETATLRTAAEATVHTVELAENLLLLTPRDADAVVLDAHTDVTIGAADVHVDV